MQFWANGRIFFGAQYSEVFMNPYKSPKESVKVDFSSS